MHNAFARLVAAALESEKFTLVDVGCSGGIETVWRLFGERFRAVGFDISIDACNRLAEIENHEDVHYRAGVVGIPPSHPFAKRAEDRYWLGNLDRTRFSAHWVVAKNQAKLSQAGLDEKLVSNAWNLTALASRPIYLLDAFGDLKFTDIDLVKIDVDGPDFLILNSLDGQFDRLGVAAARLEVCLFGGPDDISHTFHNTDRFMRAQGFDLVALENRTYSKKALPARFRHEMPAQTVTGRLFQADAFYARDPLIKSCWRPSAEKLAKLAAIYAVWNQPDSAAEILLQFRDRLGPLLDVDHGLDVLAAQTQGNVSEPLPYRDYVAAFEADETQFYPQPPPKPTLMQRLRAARASLTDAAYIAELEGRRQGDPASALTRRQANEGDPLAQYSMGLAHEYGLWALFDLVEARRWYGIAAANAPSARMKAAFLAVRDRLGRRLTPEETARADAAAAAWRRAPS